MRFECFLKIFSTLSGPFIAFWLMIFQMKRPYIVMYFFPVSDFILKIFSWFKVGKGLDLVGICSENNYEKMVELATQISGPFNNSSCERMYPGHCKILAIDTDR